ncbi:uncharacterized protein LOC119082476 [Bradysia coprophila]|uniref:uncharacterized protein LOC119073103 n=1 Tax=Bradysia coprophila TaxID=38358 RepID=UPI00187D99A9|nr:uncharacterized protein LOC119073103 [Bradysia coprophila]XP_037047891.1 uncharacterized protein LOC119082476 [Bradysia coprophila]
MGQCIGKKSFNNRSSNDDAEDREEATEEAAQPIQVDSESNGLKSIFNKDIVFSKESAVISMCQKKIHALIFVELAEDANDSENIDQPFRRIIWRGDLMPTLHGNRIMQKGDVRLVEIGANCQSDQELEKDEVFNEKCSKMVLLQSHLVSRNSAEQLIINMKNAHDIQDTSYSLTGPSTESSITAPLKGGCDNCVTWVKRMFGSINISIKTRAISKFYANSSAYAAGFNNK